MTVNDFFSNVLALPGNTGNPVDSAVTVADVDNVPGLNTLGMSMSRIDYAPWGVNPPHTHLATVINTYKCASDDRQYRATYAGGLVVAVVVRVIEAVRPTSWLP